MLEEGSSLVLFSSSRGLFNEESPVGTPLVEDEEAFCCTPNSSVNKKYYQRLLRNYTKSVYMYEVFLSNMPMVITKSKQVNTD